jgi:uncharacterized protein YlxW (UPF0749 family)
MMMSENPIRLELLGEMIRRLQADLRTLRDENKAAQGQMESFRRDVLQGFELINSRMAHLEARIDSRIDQLAEITFAIADKLGVEYRR